MTHYYEVSICAKTDTIKGRMVATTQYRIEATSDNQARFLAMRKALRQFPYAEITITKCEYTDSNTNWLLGAF